MCMYFHICTKCRCVCISLCVVCVCVCVYTMPLVIVTKLRLFHVDARLVLHLYTSSLQINIWQQLRTMCDDTHPADYRRVV